MSSNKPIFDLTIVIPALNEESRVGKTLESLAIFIDTDPVLKNLNCEVVVVNADSDDNTLSVAKKHGKKIKNFTIIRPGEKVGKGRDVRCGMLAAQGKKVLFMDADLATPLHHIPIFFNLSKQFDLVCATRNIRLHHTSITRRFVSIGGNILFKLSSGVWTEDSQCGFKLFSHDAARLCFQKQTIMKWGFDMEILTIAATNHLTTKFIRINDWRHIPDGTFDSTNTVYNSLSSLIDLGKIVRNRIMRKY